MKMKCVLIVTVLYILLLVSNL